MKAKLTSFLIILALSMGTKAIAFPFISITFIVGGPGEDCPGSSICRVVIGTGLSVSGAIGVDNAGAVVLQISGNDLQQQQPDKLQYFNAQTNTLTWTADWQVPASIEQKLGVSTTLTIPAGQYSYTVDQNNNYTIVVPQQ